MTLTVPGPEVHARYLATGLTRYSYAEVQAAVADAEQAEAEWESILDEVAALLAPYYYSLAEYGYYGYPVAWESLVKVFAATQSRVPGCYNLHLARGSSEALPLGRLAKDATAYRTAARKLRKALEATR